jgi:hypothetical protein
LFLEEAQTVSLYLAGRAKGIAEKSTLGLGIDFFNLLL